MHITKLASLYIPLSIVCAVIISPTGPQGWIDQQIGENTHRGLFCRQKWIPFLARVFDPIRNPAAHNPNVRYESLLRICATTSWGGNPDGNAGAVCSSLTPDPFQIMFDYRNGGGALRADKELAILCRTRCYCTGGTSGLLALPGRSPMPQHNIYLYRAKPGSVSMTEPIIQTVHNALTQASLCYESVSEGAEGISVFREDCFRSSEEDAQKLQCQGAIPIPNFPQ
ncbi:MAG: hypothetical protein M1814_001938, partial [Vezdaea aestivalis]